MAAAQVLEKLGALLVKDLVAPLAYCHEKVRFGVVEAINRNIRTVLRQRRGNADDQYLLLKVQQYAVAGRRLKATWSLGGREVPGESAKKNEEDDGR
jgi:hypothetical protein